MARLGCHNRPPAGNKATVQQGYVESRAYVPGKGLVPVRLPRMIEIDVSWQPVPCGYLERLACVDCEGCRWREFIEAAAIQSGDGKVHSVPRPGRHHHVIELMAETLGYPTPILGVQGFVLRGGRFVGREEARAIAVANEQCKSPAHDFELFSEDLW